MANDTPVPLNRIERILRNMIASSAGLAIIAMIATIAGRSAGMDLSTGIGPVVTVLPFVGLAVAAVLILVFLVVSVVRRRRLAQDDN